MRHYPYINHLYRVISQLLGGTWKSTYLSKTQLYQLSTFVLVAGWPWNYVAMQMFFQLSYMGSWGHKALKPSRSLGSAPSPQAC